MERVLVGLFVAGALPLALAGWRVAHTRGATWAVGAVAIVAAIPALSALLQAARGRMRITRGVLSLAIASLTVLAMALAEGRFHQTWSAAAVFGFTMFLFLTGVTRQRHMRAESALQRAATVLNQRSGNAEEALALLQQAETALGDDATLDQQANLEWLSCVAHLRLGNATRAVNHANDALFLYKRLGRSKSVDAAEDLLVRLARQGVTRPKSDSRPTPAASYVPRLALAGVVLVAALAMLWTVWSSAQGQTSPRVLVAVAGALGVWFLALPWFLGNGARQVRAWLGWALFSVSEAGLFVSLAGLALIRRTVGVGELPAPLQSHARALVEWLATIPGWVPPAVSAACLLGAAAGFLLLRSDSVWKVLEAAERELRADRWDRAIALLARFNVRKERDANARTRILFELAFAHYMSSGAGAAKHHLSDLLQEAPEHEEGLYLAAHAALASDDLDEAELLWRRLYGLNPQFAPPGAGPNQAARRYLCLTLYQKVLKVTTADSETGLKILAEIGEIGAMDDSLSGLLARVYCHRAAEHIRAQSWQVAGKELELGLQKLDRAKRDGADAPQEAKLRALCEAGLGVVALKVGRPDGAAKHFVQAHTIAKDSASDESIGGKKDDLLAHLLRAASRRRKDDKSLAPAFGRDSSFLAGIAQLNNLALQLEQGGTHDWRSALAVAQRSFEGSLRAAPEFVDGTAMLGLLYCYAGTTEAERANGLELLKKIHERVRSRFVSETVARRDAAEKDRAQARDSYFELFQQYLRSSTIPRADRQRLRDDLMARMRATGQDKSFIGRAGFEVDEDREREPTVTEYIARANMLREKLLRVGPGIEVANLSDEIKVLVEDLAKNSNELRAQAQKVVDAEKAIMQKAQALLFN